MKNKQDPVSDADGDTLAKLGYASEFKRSMPLWQNFALGFTYLSPVVGGYSLFAFGITTAGPPMIWSYGIAAVGMMMVCLVFGEIVSQFPIAGGVYPWARRLVGRKWAWFTGWIYAWAMYGTIASVALGAAAFFAPLIGIEVTNLTITVVALTTVLLSTILNMLGTKTLAKIATTGFLCEIVGAIIVGGYLLSFHRVQPLSIFVTDFGFSSATHSYTAAFLAAAVVGMFCCYGFEACGDLAEETPDPGRSIPIAMRMTIYIGISVTVFSVAGLMLAIPNMGEVISGQVADPVAIILQTSFGITGYKLILCIVLVSFVSCVLSLQAAASRLIYAYARDHMILGSRLLSRISRTTHVPVPSLILAGVIPSVIICMGLALGNALSTVVSFASVGIYIAFQLVICASIYARFRGWVPSGHFRLDAWGWLVNSLAFIYGSAAIVNVLWAREAPGSPWYVTYGQLLGLLFVAITGLLYLLVWHPERHGSAPAGDAWRLAKPSIDSTAELKPQSLNL